MSKEFVPVRDVPSPPSEFITIPEVAARLRISQMSVRRMIARGELAGVQIGRQWRIPAQAMATMLATVEKSLEAQLQQAKDKAERTHQKAAQGKTENPVVAPLANAVVASETAALAL